MNTLSKYMATTAICTLIAGSAAAQGLTAGVGADIDASVDTSTSVDTSATVATESSTGLAIDATGDTNTAASEGSTGMATDTTDGATMASTAANAETGAAINAAAQAMDRGEAVTVISADGRLLGQVESASQDERGAAELLIRLDRSLDVRPSRVTFSGLIDVDAQGHVILPMAETEFMASILAQTGGSAG